MRRFVFATVATVPLFFAVDSADAQNFGTFQVIARDGDPIPQSTQTIDFSSGSDVFLGDEGSSSLLSLSRPFANGGLTSDNTDLFSISGANVLRRLLRAQQATPSGDGRIRDFERWFIADNGVAHVATRLENVTRFGLDAVYRVSANGELTEVLRGGKALGAGLPSLCDVNSYQVSDLQWQRNGDLYINLGTSENSFCNPTAVHKIAADGTISKVVSLGAAVLGTAGTLTDISDSAAVDLLTDGFGTLFFSGRDNANGSVTSWYLARPDGVARIARLINGDEFASRNGTLTLHNTGTDQISQYINGSSTPIVRLGVGQTLPQGQGQFLNFAHVDVSTDGQILAVANLTGTAAGSNDDRGVFLVDANSVVQVAREGGPAVAAGSTFSSFTIGGFSGSSSTPSIAEGGRVLFGAEYVLSGQTRRGMFYYDRVLGLREVLNTQTLIGGSPVSGWNFASGLNERGEAVFTTTIANVDNIVLFRAPNPAEPLAVVNLPTTTGVACAAFYSVKTFGYPGVQPGVTATEITLRGDDRRLIGGLIMKGNVLRTGAFAGVTVPATPGRPVFLAPVAFWLPPDLVGATLEVVTGNTTLSSVRLPARSGAQVIPPIALGDGGGYVSVRLSPDSGNLIGDRPFAIELGVKFGDNTSAFFDSGTVVGGVIDSNNPTEVSFCMSQAQGVQIRTLGFPTYGDGVKGQYFTIRNPQDVVVFDSRN